MRLFSLLVFIISTVVCEAKTVVHKETVGEVKTFESKTETLFKSSYSYSYSSYSTSVSKAYYYSYGYSASGYQPSYSGSVSGSYEPPSKPRSNSWVEHICDLLPYRSAYIGNRCFFTISPELYPTKDHAKYIKNLFSEDFMQGVKIEIRLANVDKSEIYEELVKSNLFKRGVKYQVVKFYKGGTTISREEGNKEGFIYEFAETHSCPDKHIRFSGKCYSFNPEPKNYDDALSKCEKSGGNLPVINNDEENRFVASLVLGQSTWLATYRPKGSEDWENAGMIKEKKKLPMYFRWLSFRHDPKHRHAALFGIKNSHRFWFGYWANMDGADVTQPYVCVTKLQIGGYPDIIEPYPHGSNVTIVVSSPNSTVIVPEKCCTAAFPIVEVVNVVTPKPVAGKPVVGKDGDDDDDLPIENFNVTQGLVELYRFICSEGMREAYHMHSTSKLAARPCCQLQGQISRIINEHSYKKAKRQCPGLMQLNGFSTIEKGGQFVLVANAEKIKVYESNQNWIRVDIFGYCAPKQNYCGATLPVYEITLDTDYKRDTFYTTSNEEIGYAVSDNGIYKGLSTGVICWTWMEEQIFFPIYNESTPTNIPVVAPTDSVGGQNPPKVGAAAPGGGGTVTCTENSCGPNADCSVQNNKIECACKVGYNGDPNNMTVGCTAGIVCTTSSCGPNAVCSVVNGAISCACNLGSTGNPYDMTNGCRTRVFAGVASGDPHIQTYDGSVFDYHGTCPYILSMNCKPGNLAPYEDFKIEARNTDQWTRNGSIVSITVIAEVEIEFPGVPTIHVTYDYANFKTKLFINGESTLYDWSYPINNPNPKVTIINRPASGVNADDVTIKRYDGLEIHFQNVILTISLPDVPQFQGANKLCGILGNRDNDCKNDKTTRDGTVIAQNPQCHMEPFGDPDSNNFADSWMIPKGEFLSTSDQLGRCKSGKEMMSKPGPCQDRNSNEWKSAAEICKPIKEALDGTNTFAACRQLGIKLYKFFESCSFDICLMPETKCSVISAFVDRCRNDVPFAHIGPWRPQFNCPIKDSCPPHSKYSNCSSKCAPTCQTCHFENGKQVCLNKVAKHQPCSNQTTKVCDADSKTAISNCRWVTKLVCPKPSVHACVDSCIEGCVCDEGLVIDKSNGFRCVKLDQCPSSGGSANGFVLVPYTLCGKQKATSKQKDLYACGNVAGEAPGYQYRLDSQECIVWEQIYGICPLELKIQTADFLRTNRTNDPALLLKRIIEIGRATTPPADIAVTCPNNNPAFKNRCLILQNNLFFVDAVNLCKSHGGNLISIHSAAENNYILETFNKYGKNADSSPNPYVWTGMYDPTGKWKETIWYSSDVTTFRWMDGSKLDYRNFNPTINFTIDNVLLPDTYGSCILANKDFDPNIAGIWSFGYSSQDLRSICEARYAYVPWTICGDNGMPMQSINWNANNKQNDPISCAKFAGDAQGFSYRPDTGECFVWKVLYGICPQDGNIKSLDFIKAKSTSNYKVLLQKVIEYGRAQKADITKLFVSCPTNVAAVANRCYFVTRLSYWDDASAECKSYGGDLTSIHSQAENDFIKNAFYTPVINEGIYGWVGLYDPSKKYTAETYQWTDGTPMDYKFWFPNQPFGEQAIPGQAHCGSICTYRAAQYEYSAEDSFGKWGHTPCTVRSRGICQVKI